MKRSFAIVLRCENRYNEALPEDDKVAKALAHSTAAEALATALGCSCSMDLTADAPEVLAALERGLTLADYIDPRYRKEADAHFNEFRTAIRKARA